MWTTIPELVAQLDKAFEPEIHEVPAVYVGYPHGDTSGSRYVYGAAPPFQQRRCRACKTLVTFEKQFVGRGMNGDYVLLPAIKHWCRP